MMVKIVAEATQISDYQEVDAPAIARLFYETVRSVNRADYSEEQVEAWAPAVPDAREWHARMADRKMLVAEEGGEVVGFCELEKDGHLDMFYLRSYVPESLPHARSSLREVGFPMPHLSGASCARRALSGATPRRSEAGPSTGWGYRAGRTTGS